MTRYTYRTTITVTVDMADEDKDFDGEPVHWDSPEAQQESAREYAEQAMGEDGPEEWVSVDCPPLALVSAEKVK